MMDQSRYISKLEKILTLKQQHEYTENNNKLIDFGYECIDRGEYKKAFQLFCIDMRLNGYDPDSLNGLGVCLSELGRYKTSMTVFEKTMELYPDDAITLSNIAGLYWMQDDVGKSIYYYNKSLDSDPNIFETHFNLINCFYELGHLYTAYIACLNLLNLFPDNLQAIEMRDDIILDMGISIY